jgi:O-antigen/teichoic acid export membrane protein
VVSGYVLLGVNILYTFGSVPLVLHYLSKKEIGLWGVVTQIAGYLVLIDLGMASSISRILIDHKDSTADGVYGAIIKTGVLVLLVQGAIVAVAGAVVSLWLPDLFHVPLEHRQKFQILVAGHCLVLGGLFVGRMFNYLLLAHQRYDAMNYGQMGGLLINFAGMWLGFAWGWGLYSLLCGYAANTLLQTGVNFLAVKGLKLFPSAGAWGKANLKTFKELFNYGREVFMMSVGWQLVNASQMLVIGRTLGFDVAGIWSIATKPFTMAQQVVFRLLDYAGAGLAEMMVRQERERLLTRFRDVVIISASLAVWIGLAVALCNYDFLALWTKGEVSWGKTSDWLMGLMVAMYATTRCYIGFIGLTKQIRAMKYMYPLEGVVFIGLSILTARVWGMNGVIASAVVTNLICSGLYGFFRTKEYFGFRESRELAGWLKWPFLCLVTMGAIFGLVGWADAGWSHLLRLSVNGAVAGLAGAALFWQLGLTPQLRTEALTMLRKLRLKLLT